MTAGTAEAELRPLSTDRPDTTESPLTVDPGYWQMEVELMAWERERSTSAYHVMETTLKLGVGRATDVQVVIPWWSRTAEGQEGMGDLSVRLKYNLWGNEGGDTALGVMPFLTFPTAAEGLGASEVEGGLILAYSIEGSGRWELGAMVEADVRSVEDGGHRWGGVFSAVASHPLGEHWSGFVELAVDVEEHQAPQWSAHVGLVWSPQAHWHLDGGVRLGLNDAATDVVPFLGWACKF